MQMPPPTSQVLGVVRQLGPAGWLFSYASSKCILSGLFADDGRANSFMCCPQRATASLQNNDSARWVNIQHHPLRLPSSLRWVRGKALSCLRPPGIAQRQDQVRLHQLDPAQHCAANSAAASEPGGARVWDARWGRYYHKEGICAPAAS